MTEEVKLKEARLIRTIGIEKALALIDHINILLPEYIVEPKVFWDHNFIYKTPTGKEKRISAKGAIIEFMPEWIIASYYGNSESAQLLRQALTDILNTMDRPYAANSFPQWSFVIRVMKIADQLKDAALVEIKESLL